MSQVFIFCQDRRLYHFGQTFLLQKLTCIIRSVTNKLNKKEIILIFKKNFNSKPREITPLEKGDVNEMYVISAARIKKKFVLRIINDSSLNNELFFFEKSKKVSASVPQTYQGGKTNCNRDYYFMDYIEPTNNPQKSIKLLSDNLKKIHSVKLDGFGKITNSDWKNPKFSDPDFHSWIKKEIGQLVREFEKLGKLDTISVLQKTLKILNFLPNRKKSVLVHGDLGFGNTIMIDNKLYLIDPGWFIAMTPLYEIAKFDHKYYGLPKKENIIRQLHKNYFKRKLRKEEMLELFIFRVIHSAMTYWWFLKEKNPKFKQKEERLKRNTEGFYNFLNKS